jgi:hypothetical protein
MYSVLYESLAYVRTTLSTLNQLLIGVFTAIHLTFNYTFKKLLNRIESKVLWELSEISYKPSNEYATDLPKLSNELYYTSLTAPVYELSSNIKLADDGEVLVNFFQKNALPTPNTGNYNYDILDLRMFSGFRDWGFGSLEFLNNDSTYLTNHSNNVSYLPNTTYQLTPLNLNTLAQNQHHLLLNTFSLQESSAILKQSRWLLKNSLVSEDLIKQNNMILNSKRLLGSPLWDIRVTDGNIWLSNFVGNGNSGTLTSQLGTTQYNSLDGLNTYEEGREFLLKRYLSVANSRNIPHTKLLNPAPQNLMHQFSATKFFSTQTVLSKSLLLNNNLLLVRAQLNGQFESPQNNKLESQNDTSVSYNTQEILNNYSSNLMYNLTTNSLSDQPLTPVNVQFK